MRQSREDGRIKDRCDVRASALIDSLTKKINNEKK